MIVKKAVTGELDGKPCIWLEGEKGEIKRLARMNSQEILNDPAASFWLKSAINACLNRDAVDALTDAEVLVEVLKDHLNKIQEAK